MSVGRLKCKDNNAVYVKRIMPEAFRNRTHQQAPLCTDCSMYPRIKSLTLDGMRA